MDRLTLELLAAQRPRYPTIYHDDDDDEHDLALIECAECSAGYLKSVSATGAVEVLKWTREAPEVAGQPCRCCRHDTEA